MTFVVICGSDKTFVAKTGAFPAAPRLRTPGSRDERRLGLLDAVDCLGRFAGEIVVEVHAF